VSGLHLAAILQRSGTEAAENTRRSNRSELGRLLSIPEIRLVVIATPNETHYPFARQCLETGRDVVVDKPFATTLEEANHSCNSRRNQAACSPSNQNRRYDGDFQAIRQLVEAARWAASSASKQLMTASAAAQSRRLAGDLAPGSGILFDIAPHLIDHALVLFGLAGGRDRRRSNRT